MLKQEVADACIAKLRSSDIYQQDYVFEYLFTEISRLMDKPNGALLIAIKRGLKNGDKRFYNAMGSLWRLRMMVHKPGKPMDKVS